MQRAVLRGGRRVVLGMLGGAQRNRPGSKSDSPESSKDRIQLVGHSPINFYCAGCEYTNKVLLITDHTHIPYTYHYHILSKHSRCFSNSTAADLHTDPTSFPCASHVFGRPMRSDPFVHGRPERVDRPNPGPNPGGPNRAPRPKGIQMGRCRPKGESRRHGCPFFRYEEVNQLPPNSSTWLRLFPLLYIYSFCLEMYFR